MNASKPPHFEPRFLQEELFGRFGHEFTFQVSGRPATCTIFTQLPGEDIAALQLRRKLRALYRGSGVRVTRIQLVRTWDREAV